MDTLTVAGKSCVDLTFRAFQLRVVWFYGTSVRHAGQHIFSASRSDRTSPQKINLNFVDYMKIEQNFDSTENSRQGNS